MATELAVRNGHDLDVQTIGQIFVKSGYFADTREASQAIVKVLAGRELGFGPIASMQGVYIVKGKVTYSANLVGAAIQRSGRYTYRVRQLDDKSCTIDFFENGTGPVRGGGVQRQKIGESTFTEQDAVKASLQGGENWKKYPRNMLFARALTNGARWYCPDVFNGPVYTPDELGEEVDEEGAPVALPAVQPVVEATHDQDAYDESQAYAAAVAERARLVQQARELGGRPRELRGDEHLPDIEQANEALRDWIASHQPNEQQEAAF